MGPARIVWICKVVFSVIENESVTRFPRSLASTTLPPRWEPYSRSESILCEDIQNNCTVLRASEEAPTTVYCTLRTCCNLCTTDAATLLLEAAEEDDDAADDNDAVWNNLVNHLP